MNYSKLFSALLGVVLLNASIVFAASDSEDDSGLARVPVVTRKSSPLCGAGATPTTTPHGSPSRNTSVPGVLPTQLKTPGSPDYRKARKAMIQGIAQVAGIIGKGRTPRASVASIASINSMDDIRNMKDDELTATYLRLCVQQNKAGEVVISIGAPKRSGRRNPRKRTLVLPPASSDEESDKEDDGAFLRSLPTGSGAESSDDDLPAVPSAAYAPGTLPPLVPRPSAAASAAASTGDTPRYTSAQLQERIDAAVAAAMAASPAPTSTSVGSAHVPGTTISQGAYDAVILRPDIDDTAIIRATAGEAVERAEEYQVVPRRQETCCSKTGRLLWKYKYLETGLTILATIAPLAETYHDDRDNDGGRDDWRLVGFITSGILFAKQYHAYKGEAAKQAYWNDRTATTISVLRNLAAVTMVAAHKLTIAFGLTPAASAGVRRHVIKSLSDYDPQTQETLLADDAKMGATVKAYLQKLAGEVKAPLTKDGCWDGCTRKLSCCTERFAGCARRLKKCCCCKGALPAPQPPALTKEAENILATAPLAKGCWEKFTNWGYAPEEGEGWLLDRELLHRMYQHQKDLNALMGESHAMDFSIGSATVSEWYVHHLGGILGYLNRLIDGPGNDWLVPVVSSSRDCLTEMCAQARRPRA